MNKLKKRALRVIAEHLSVEEVADIKEMFSKIDVNNTGNISLEELKFGLHKLGHQIPDADVKILMDAGSTQPECTFSVTAFI
ncbi:uncharacterized protein A4U43_C05F18890 [Asparagus officinalis]|uniref:EF-hand domain-containing protein n=1 Tax=Asparagus officinalis TaxID=4686 RepID=A0A5P1EST1_ASPOF|nr:uncharacterized protein A4U43_C05F18890 [Asparagus officinalis]